MKLLKNYSEKKIIFVIKNFIKYKLFLIALILFIANTSSDAQFKLPNYKVIKLDNGLTIYLMQKKDVPLISFSAVFDAGATKDEQTYGLASFTAEAIKFGTKNFNKSQIDSIFNFYGSNLNTYANLDYSGLYTQFMKEDVGTLLPVIKDVIVNPVFPQSEIEKRKQRWIVELDQAKESPRQVIGSYFNKFLFGDFPYGNPVNGTKSGIESVSQSKINSFYKSYYNPESSAFAVVGDFDPEVMLSLIKNQFNDWKAEENVQAKNFVFNKIDFNQPRVYLINKDNATEITFMIGGFGVPINCPDQVQLDVINTILGGRFTSWLNDELRVNAGYTYGARSRFASYKYTGTFYISTFTATKNTEPAIDLALKTYERLFNNGIDEKTLSSAKNYVKGQFPPEYETARSLSGFLIQKFIYGLDDSYINNFQKIVDQMTITQVNELIKKYFPKNNLQFVLIGKSEAIKNIAEKYGKIIEKNISEDGF